jgi:GalNAc-alpha-(1->4)-GalNAc-alpha-(1->3)-diNAcBac-PP-undecaprenol alpha-1,4-N-acetyl-D-galactosaminyltransferase
MERVMSELAYYFSAKNETIVHLVLYGKGRELFYDVPDSVQIHRPGWMFSDKKRTLHTLKTLKFLRQKVKDITPDVVLSFGEYWNSFVLLSLKGLQIPIYISDRCNPDKNLGKLHELLRKWLYPGAAGMIAQTEKAKQIYNSLRFNSNICVIGNPIREISANAESEEKENVVLTVGRLIDTKHHDRLIEIFDQAAEKDWKLIIIGGNAIKQNGMSKLEKIIEVKGLRDRVILTGMVSNVEEYYLKSKIFAFTSSSEGFPNVVGEAMSAGLPVISYDCIAGPSEMIKDGETGYLLNLFDDEAFKKRLEQLMKDEALRNRMGEVSKVRIKSFSLNNICEQFYEFISGSIKN